MKFNKDNYSIKEVKHYAGDPHHPQGIYAIIKLPCGRVSPTCVYVCGEDEAEDIENGVIKERSAYGKQWELYQI